MNLSVACLGGAGEIGMNMYVYETPKYALIVDAGVKFARAEDPGVDLIIPDFEYLKSLENKKEILLLITHGHEDHTGAIPFLLSEFPNISVVSNSYTIDLFKHKLLEYGISLDRIIHITPYNAFEWGDMEITAIPISHSIHGTTAIKIKFEDGFVAVHMSDYKIDTAPVTSDPFPIKDFLNLGNEGVNLLLSDSTNILNPHFTRGEYIVKNNLRKIFQKTTGRIFFTTFASNTERLQTLFDLAVEFKKKIVIEGSSLLRNIETARNYNKLSINEDLIINRKAMKNYENNELLVIATGSQGEFSSVISKIARNEYGNMNVLHDDTYIFSSRIIPGNEQYVLYIINNINRNNANCYTAENLPIHVSGHASKFDAELLLKLLKPDYLVPVHGEAQHLKEHKLTAIKLGMKKDHVITWYAGEKIFFKDGYFDYKEEIPAGKRFVDRKSGEILSQDELKNRRRLSVEGTILLVIKKPILNYLDKDMYLLESIGYSTDFYDKNRLINEMISQVELYCKPIFGDYVDKRFNQQYPSLAKDDNYNLYTELYNKILNDNLSGETQYIDEIFDYDDLINVYKKNIHKYFKKYYNIKPAIKIIDINKNKSF